MKSFAGAIAALLVSAVSLSAATDAFRITVSAANVRREPSYTAPIITTVKKDARLTVIDASEQWIKVEVADQNGQRTIGYVLNSLGILERTIEVVRESSPPRVAPSPQAAAPVIAAPAAPATRDLAVALPAVSAASPALTRSLAAERERNDWNLRLEDAQQRRKKGLRLVIYGVGIATVGTIVGVTMIQGSDSYGGVQSGSAIGTFSSLGGGALATWGAFRWFGANSAIDDIDREGRQKGYLSVVPTRDGIYASASIGF